MLYPLKFKPVFKDKIWGGDRIRKTMGLDFAPLPNCGEAWMLSGVQGCQTTVQNGFLAGNELNEILEIYMDELVGERVFEEYQSEFPLLIKFIDANDYLSIQVHPDDELAAKRNIGRGKTEMWYILDADPGAELITGFDHEVTQETYLRYLREKRLKELMDIKKVRAGETYFIPAGLVHALGPGILLAEIQQTSDTTYRIYDWDRLDSEGKARELHTELALEAIDFKSVPFQKRDLPLDSNGAHNLVTCPYFTTNHLTFSKQTTKDYGDLDSFVIYICTEGAFQLEAGTSQVAVRKGDVLLLPAVTEIATLVPLQQSQLLEVYI